MSDTLAVPPSLPVAQRRMHAAPAKVQAKTTVDLINVQRWPTRDVSVSRGNQLVRCCETWHKPRDTHPWHEDSSPLRRHGVVFGARQARYPVNPVPLLNGRLGLGLIQGETLHRLQRGRDRHLPEKVVGILLLWASVAVAGRVEPREASSPATFLAKASLPGNPSPIPEVSALPSSSSSVKGAYFR